MCRSSIKISPFRLQKVICSRRCFVTVGHKIRMTKVSVRHFFILLFLFAGRKTAGSSLQVRCAMNVISIEYFVCARRRARSMGNATSFDRWHRTIRLNADGAFFATLFNSYCFAVINIVIDKHRPAAASNLGVWQTKGEDSWQWIGKVLWTIPIPRGQRDRNMGTGHICICLRWQRWTVNKSIEQGWSIEIQMIKLLRWRGGKKYRHRSTHWKSYNMLKKMLGLSNNYTNDHSPIYYKVCHPLITKWPYTQTIAIHQRQ